MSLIRFTAPVCAALACASVQTHALPILGSDLASFTVLGASTVINVPTSTIVGNVGVWSSGGGNANAGWVVQMASVAALPFLVANGNGTGNGTVPTPATALLFGVGLAGPVRVRRTSRRA